MAARPWMVGTAVVSVTCGLALGEIVGPYDIDPVAWVDELGPHSALNPVGNGGVVGSDLEGAMGLGGSGGFMTLRFTDNLAANRQGDDIVIFELRTPEAFIVDIAGILRTVTPTPIEVPGISEVVNAATVELTDFGIAIDATIGEITLRQGGTSADIAAVAALNWAPIPEPATLGMLALGGLGAIRRRTR